MEIKETYICLKKEIHRQHSKSMKSKIVFEKMHGIGNDFVLIDNRIQDFSPDIETIRKLSDRHTGIGFDQLLLLDNPPNGVDCDASIRFFNPDGSEAEQCGNGQRCVSFYLSEKNPEKNEFKVCGMAGVMKSTVHENGKVTVNMGPSKNIDPINHNDNRYIQVDFGNPHLVRVVESVGKEDLNNLSQELTYYYPDGINLEIVEIISSKEIKIRVHERGTGETLACGSGACASVIALHHENKLGNKVKVILPGGELMVESIESGDILLNGEAVHVFSGEMNL